MYFNNATAKLRIRLHFRDIVQQKKQLPVARARQHLQLFATTGIRIKARIEDFFFLIAAAHLFCISLPAFAIRRIAQHKIKLSGRIAIKRKRRTISNMLRFFTITLKQHIRLTDSISFRVDFLPKKMNRNFFIMLPGNLQKPVLRNSKHTAGTTCAIIARISCVLNLVFYRHHRQVSHKLYNIARCPVLASFLVIVFVEFSNQLFKNRTHSMIIKCM